MNDPHECAEQDERQIRVLRADDLGEPPQRVDRGRYAPVPQLAQLAAILAVLPHPRSSVPAMVVGVDGEPRAVSASISRA